MNANNTAEHLRLAAYAKRLADWKNWGPYLSERAWGTVREDYSANGDAWVFFPHDHARSRAYRWNEDGIGGFCNRFQNVCMAVAMWNERDPILKERFFGLTSNEGNHGEDVKEYYYYLDGTPTHSYMKMLYKYPQAPFPYAELVDENRLRNRHEREFELIDALRHVFSENRYFDVFIEYAKATEEDILCRITAINRGPDPAPIHLLPHLWFRNTWSWGYNRPRPEMVDASHGKVAGVKVTHRHLGERWWYVFSADTNPPVLLFTENDTNNERLFGTPNASSFVKDGINDAVLHHHTDRINQAGRGTKVAADLHKMVMSQGCLTVNIRFSDRKMTDPFADFSDIFDARIDEADDFYAAIQAAGLTTEERSVQRQAFAGLLWNKQFYHFGIDQWLSGDPAGPLPPASRSQGRNSDWTHLYNLDVLSMPDKWEYPWFAAWDLAFHMIPLAMIDPKWAKRQLTLLLREWYMHPNGQMPAYEWSFGDVNPPVHAWAAMRVYKIDRNISGVADTDFLESIFHKLLLNFTWWVNRKDDNGNNIFQGGFLGLDNIGVFDRSAPLPTGGRLGQVDGTAWMGMYCLNMLGIALELARTKPAYEDVATKFFEHFVYIAFAINRPSDNHGLWNEEDGFYYDMLYAPQSTPIPLKIRSFVGLIPLFAVEILDVEVLEKLPRFRKRMEWFLQFRSYLLNHLSLMTGSGKQGRWLLSLVNKNKIERVMDRMLDQNQFLSEYGLRSLSKEHESMPFFFHVNGQSHTVGYEPAESTTNLFGGNSNWRGPIWFPLNYLMIESLQRYHHYFGDALKVEMPARSGRLVTLDEVARDLSKRLTSIFMRDQQGNRPFYGGVEYFQNDPHWRDYILFYEYFHGDNGAGMGASHQTGWTALVAKLIQQTATKGSEIPANAAASNPLKTVTSRPDRPSG